MANMEKLIPVTGLRKLGQWIKALAVVLDISRQHLTDIETGVAEGLYDQAENAAGLVVKSAAVASIKELQAALEQTHRAADGGKDQANDALGSSAPPSYICLMDDVKLATLLAALRFYQAAGMADSVKRSTEIDDIATNGGALVSIDEAGIDELCEQLAFPATKDDVLESLKAHMNLKIGDCVKLFADDVKDAPYVDFARDQLSSDEVEIDDVTMTAPGDDGAFVMAWLWVSNEDAKAFRIPELLECVLDAARIAILKTGSSQLDDVYGDWLEDLVGNFADDLDEIAFETPNKEPGPVIWLDAKMESYEFHPSVALQRLLDLAKKGGLSETKATRVQAFCDAYGKKLDAILSVPQTA